MLEFVCTTLAKTESIGGHMKGKPSVRSVCCLLLEKYAPQSHFSSEKHMSSSRKRTILFVVNTYYKNKQRVMNDKVRKDSVKTFTSRQRNKEHSLNHSPGPVHCLCLLHSPYPVHSLCPSMFPANPLFLPIHSDCPSTPCPVHSPCPLPFFSGIPKSIKYISCLYLLSLFVTC